MSAICSVAFGALAALEMLTCPPPDTAGVAGYFSRYDEAPTVGTMAYRQSVGDLPLDMSGYAGMIAVADCGLIGRDAWVQIGDSGWLPVVVFDCAGHAETVEWFQTNKIVAELDWYLASSFGFTGTGAVPGRLLVENRK